MFHFRASPTILNSKMIALKQKLKAQSSKMYTAFRKIKRLKRKVSSLLDVVRDLKKKELLSPSALDYLQKTFSEIPQALIKRMLGSVGSNTVPRTKYPPELRKFAITLHFFNCKAYDYVRETFNLALPHPSVIRKWCNVVECNPGFSTVCLNALKDRVLDAEKKNQKVICSLMFYEMAIKKQTEFDGVRNWGYVDIGFPVDNYQVEPATEALVLMVVSHYGGWKLPIGYFLIKSLTGSEKANIINEALVRLHDINVEVTSVTCDGPPAHFAMFRALGCDFAPNKMRTHFPHPTDAQIKVFAIFDACHMFKMVRNCFGNLQVLVDSEGGQIKWEYLKKLHSLQSEETLTLANKLGKKHMEWRKHKMRVSLIFINSYLINFNAIF